MDVGPAYTAMCDLDVDIHLLESFGLVGLEFHITINRGGIEAHPALESVVIGHLGLCRCDLLVSLRAKYFTAALDVKESNR